MREDLSRPENALREMRALSAQLPGAIERQNQEFRDNANAYLSQKRADLETQQQYLDWSTPKPLGNQVDFINPTTPRAMIFKYQAFGTLIYREVLISAGRNSEEIGDLTRRVASQEAAFKDLTPEEQTKIRDEVLASQGKSPVVQPYVDYLYSSFLGERFEELAQQKAAERSKK